jgi:hypothetical protein
VKANRDDHGASEHLVGGRAEEAMRALDDSVAVGHITPRVREIPTCECSRPSWFTARSSDGRPTHDCRRFGRLSGLPVPS